LFDLFNFEPKKLAALLKFHLSLKEPEPVIELLSKLCCSSTLESKTSVQTNVCLDK